MGLVLTPGTSSGSSTPTDYRATKVAGKYYALTLYGTSSGTAGPSTSTVSGIPITLDRAVTFDQFSIQISTLGGNLQLALYAQDAVTVGRWTGTPLVYTASIDVTATGNKTAALAGGTLVSGGVATIPAGRYVLCMNVDNNAVRGTVFSTVNSRWQEEYGSTTIGNVMAAGGLTNYTTFTVAHAYSSGSWPDLTGIVPTSEAAGARVFHPFIKAA